LGDDTKCGSEREEDPSRLRDLDITPSASKAFGSFCVGEECPSCSVEMEERDKNQ
jgi:hypothetical protein